jgi:hypothetical protein
VPVRGKRAPIVIVSIDLLGWRAIAFVAVVVLGSNEDEVVRNGKLLYE